MNTKQLRQKILDLAIRGKLVQQDPGEAITNYELKITDVPFDIPESWAWNKISDISLSIQYGYTGSAIASGKYKMLRITDIQNNSVDWESVPFVEIDDKKADIYLLSNDDIVFARTGATVGKSFLIKDLEEQSVFASYLIRIKLKEDINVQYVKYFFESGYYWGQIEDKSVGTGQPNVNGTLLGELQIPIPPLSEQRRIVSEIEHLFPHIDSIEQNKLSLEQIIKQAKSKILDLAIHGKLVPQDSNELITNYELKITDVPFDIPKSWRWCKLEDIGNWSAGTTPSRTNSKYYAKGTIPWLKTGDLNDDIITSVSEYISESALKECKQLKLNPIGSVAIALYGATIGRCGILNIETTTNQACCVCKPNSIIFNKFLFYFLLSHREDFKNKAEGGAQPNISKDKIINTLIPLPPLAEQKRIVNQIETIFKTLDSIQNNL